jgi:hypothetical protein
VTQLRLNSPNVISETIEDETIIINLLTGTYYSLRGSGAEIWAAIQAGSSEEQLVEELVERYDADRETIASAVEDVIEELRSEELVVVDSETERSAALASNTRLNGKAGAATSQFVLPSIEKYTDMQDIILLDPVHEVGEQGWPHPAEA